MRKIVWFSCGAASACVAKLVTEKYPDCIIAYCDVLSNEHPDNLRFLRDVERWIGKDVLILKSDKYASIDDVFIRTRYMSGIAGARCTTEMKKLVREKFQQTTDIHFMGYTLDEQKRADRFEENNPALNVEWILIDNKITKKDCLKMIRDAVIELPAMYGLGFDHNNCLGCVKSTSAGYWNRTRRLFPEVFKKRAEQSRAIGCRLVWSKGGRKFLDELPQEEHAPDDDIDCGPMCQMPFNFSG